MFTTKDMAGVSYPHGDAIIIAEMTGNYNIRRILIDMRSSADMLYTTAYDQMTLGREKITGMIALLTGLLIKFIFLER